jgi:hypothetical protein
LYRSANRDRDRFAWRHCNDILGAQGGRIASADLFNASDERRHGTASS